MCDVQSGDHLFIYNIHILLTHFNGKDFFRILFTRPIVALNSSGATRDCNPGGKLVLKLLLNPNLKSKINKRCFLCSVISCRERQIVAN